MPRTRVKICGITDVAAAVAAVTAGADALGLVFFAGSRRAVVLDQAREILAGLPAMVTAVGLFVNAERRDVIELCASLPLGLLQFHGDEEAAYCASFGRPWMKAIRVSDDTDIRAEVTHYPGASAILLDTFVAGVRGGTGEAFDWSRIPSNLDIPLVLAGGLTADNVGVAIATAAPFAVDVSGGVESEPGIKNHKLIEDFLGAVRTADELTCQGSER